MISVLIPAYRQPLQLREALASLAQQDRSVIGEIIIGDDSPRAEWPANQNVIAESGLADLIQYVGNEPSLGTYPNHWSLARRARFDRLLFLHHDDVLEAGGLAPLVAASDNESDPRVKLWFGTHRIMDEHGTVDRARSEASDRQYGRDSPPAAKPVWEWSLKESIPSNCFLVDTETYRRHMVGERDGNVGDWATVVRLANAGVWARYTAQIASSYRVQASSVTNAGRGVDVHRSYELAMQLKVPPERQDELRERFFGNMLVVTVRYLRDGERMNALKCLMSPHLSWKKRLSARGISAMLMLLTPRPAWHWAIRHKV